MEGCTTPQTVNKDGRRKMYRWIECYIYQRKDRVAQEGHISCRVKLREDAHKKEYSRQPSSSSSSTTLWMRSPHTSLEPSIHMTWQCGHQQSTPQQGSAECRAAWMPSTNGPKSGWSRLTELRRNPPGSTNKLTVQAIDRWRRNYRAGHTEVPWSQTGQETHMAS